MGKLLHPPSLGVIQPLLQSIHDDLIYGLSLPISLRVGWSGIPVFYSQIRTVFLEGFTVKLKTVIRDEDVGNTEPRNYVLPDESFDIHIPDIG